MRMGLINASNRQPVYKFMKRTASVSLFPVTTISDKYEYSNIKIKCSSNIICICIFAISWLRIYSDIHLVNTWHPNIFEYLLNKFCGIQIYSDIRFDPLKDICSSLGCSTFPLFPHDHLVQKNRVIGGCQAQIVGSACTKHMCESCCWDLQAIILPFCYSKDLTLIVCYGCNITGWET